MVWLTLNSPERSTSAQNRSYLGRLRCRSGGIPQDLEEALTSYGLQDRRGAYRGSGTPSRSVTTERVSGLIRMWWTEAGYRLTRKVDDRADGDLRLPIEPCMGAILADQHVLTRADDRAGAVGGTTVRFAVSRSRGGPPLRVRDRRLDWRATDRCIIRSWPNSGAWPEARQIGTIDRMREEEAQRRHDAVHRRHGNTVVLLLDLEPAQVVGCRCTRRPAGGTSLGILCRGDSCAASLGRNAACSGRRSAADEVD